MTTTMTIPGVPEYLTREQYTSLISAVGLDPDHLIELRFAADGIHALTLAVDGDGKYRVNPQTDAYYKHRVFVPIRDKDKTDTRTSRITPVGA
jgi:hypothetical protein